MSFCGENLAPETLQKQPGVASKTVQEFNHIKSRWVTKCRRKNVARPTCEDKDGDESAAKERQHVDVSD